MPSYLRGLLTYSPGTECWRANRLRSAGGTPLFLSRGSVPSGEHDGTSIDFRSFLTQRSLQSFMFLLAATRDLFTIRWLDNFTQPVIPDLVPVSDSTLKLDYGFANVSSLLLQYHGLNALNNTLFPTWDSYFKELLDQPAEVLLIESGNPGTPFKSFEVDIDPARLCSRILSVREQIAKEWVSDLDILAKMGGQVFRSYWENVRREREEGSISGGSSSTSNTTKGFDREGLWFLDYDKSDDNDLAPSPLRKGNFDLLKLLATEESVRRVLRNVTAFNDEDSNTEDEGKMNNFASREFLKSFYLDRAHSHFWGYKMYGRADDFVEEMMLVPPRMVMAGKGDAVAGLVDPLRIAEAVIKERERVAMDWKELASQSPVEHTEIRKLQLDKMMGL